MKRKILALVLSTVLVVSMGLVMAGPVGADPDPGIVALWHLDGDATDSSGNGNNGTEHGSPSWINDQWTGQAVDLNGSNAYIDFGNVTQLDGLSAFTVEFWVKADSLPFSGYQGMVSRGSTFQRSPWVYGHTGQKYIRVHFETITGGAADGRTVTGDLTQDMWHHVAFTWDGTTVTPYLDGVAGTTDTTVGSVLVDTDGSLKIGYLPSYAYFNGKIDEVRIWDTTTLEFNLDLEPDTADNPVMTDHSVTATVTIERTDGGYEPAPGVEVNFEVISGPNSGDSGSARTNSSGVATFTYTGNGGSGTDTIRAWADQDFSNDFDETQDAHDEATKDWYIPVPIDIKPTSCPNPLNLKSKGVLPVAILGTEDFDVTQIDPDTVNLGFGPGSEPFDPVIPPDEKKTALEDVATPYDGEFDGCLTCWEEGQDGFLDLTLKYPTQEIAAALAELGLDVDGSCVTLYLRGNLKEDFGGTEIIGDDVVRIINKGAPNSPVAMESVAALENVESFAYCTDEPEYGQIKVAQVPIPWQFWFIDEHGNLIDRIRVSPTWLEPPIGRPDGGGDISVRRMWTPLAEPVSLEDLIWDQLPNLPGARWQEDPVPIPASPGEDVDLDLGIPESPAYIVAYEVILEDEVVGHFVNEAILEEELPLQIAKILVNFDIHNTTQFDITNFELEFLGLEFTCADVDWALGFVLPDPTDPGPVELWGAHENSPLVVRPVDLVMADGTEMNATEVKWVEACRPLVYCDWVHLGLEFSMNLPIEDLQNNPITVQGYWTELGPKVWCEEAVNPHGKNVPPAGWSTMPGKKGGQNDEGFYKLRAVMPPCPPVLQPLWIEIGYVDTNGDEIRLADPAGNIIRLKVNDVVKITEAPKAVPSIKKIGSSKGNAGSVKVHITIPSDPILYLVTPSGDIATCDECLVPPPPK